MKKNGTNSVDMRQLNQKLLLNILRQENISRAEAARRTGLSKAAIGIIVDDLIEEGILCETVTESISIGRKPVLLMIRPESRFAIGVSITRKKSEIGVMNIQGELIYNEEIEISKEGDAIEDIDRISERLKEIVEELGIEENKILGVGIAAPGPLNVDEGSLLEPLHMEKWFHVNMVKLMQSRVPWVCYLENTTVARAILEKNYGVAKKLNDFVVYKIEDVIGAGIIVNNAIHRGVSGNGGEWGHVSIDFQGRRCECGRRGCLEKYASISAILEEFGQFGYTSWKDIVDDAYKGNEKALSVIQSEAMYLSAAIVNVANCLLPRAFILCGEINYRSQLLLALIQEQIDSTWMMRKIQKIAVMAGSVSEYANLKGAATIVIEHFFQEGEI